MELVMDIIFDRTGIDDYLTIPLLLMLAALLLMDRELIELLFARRVTEKAELQRYSMDTNGKSGKLYAHFLTEKQRLLRMEVQPSQLDGCLIGAHGLLTHRGRRFLAFKVHSASGQMKEE